VAVSTLLKTAVPVLGADYLNLAGDYGYMTTGYYASLDAELAGNSVLPTTAEALDAYVVPIALAKAQAAGINVPDFELVTDRFPPPPFMAYPVNPFSLRGELITDGESLEKRRNGLTYTGKYAVLCQLLPPDYRIDVVRCVLGRSLVSEYAEFSSAVFHAFRLPLARMRVIVAFDAYLLSALEPLPYSELTLREKELLREGTKSPS
jgi:hypothetical protein